MSDQKTYFTPKDILAEGATFDLECGTSILPDGTSSYKPVVRYIERRNYDELPDLLKEAEEGAQLPQTKVTSAKMSLVVTNLNSNDKWAEHGPSGELGQLFDVMKVNRDAICLYDKITWNCYPPEWDTNSDRPPTEKQVVVRSFATFRCGVVWKYYPETATTTGIIWFGENRRREQAARILQFFERHPRLVCNPFMIGFVAMQQLWKFEEWRAKGHAGDIQTAQIASGLHKLVEYTTGKVTEESNWGHISSEVSGLAVLLANSECATHRMIAFLNEIHKLSNEMSWHHPDLKDTFEASRIYLNQHYTHWAQECHFLLETTQNWQRNAATVVSGIFNLVARKDQLTNIQIAKDQKFLAEQSQQIANESRILAADSKKDSTSMMAIAAVTMFFLPGTFVASFLAMPIFALDPTTNKLSSHQVWIYWVVTIPLTIVTVVAWLIWNHAGNRYQRRKREKAIERALERSVRERTPPGTEVGKGEKWQD